MSPQEENYFQVLSEHRTKLANAIEDPALRGVKDSVVEKYSDQAHFIYELLQNADDTGATYVRFVLNKNELLFAHNGKRFFSISDPKNEKNDINSDNLGDINSITSVGNSNKLENKIGKFGVGFKAVFQYTATPHIFDPNICFRVERFIVPVRLSNDHPDRKQHETLFIFPFDHTERKPHEAYADISEKLFSLVYPVLFLTNLKEILYECSEKKGAYKKKKEVVYPFSDITAQFLILTQENENCGQEEKQREKIEDKIWLFTKNDNDGRSYSVGFPLDTDNHLRPVDHYAFCFFPTKTATCLKFIIHAPFLLTDSREGIKTGEAHNKDLIERLAYLSTESLCHFKFIEQERSVKLIDDNIVNIIPYDESKFVDINDKRKILFKPFYLAIKEIFSKEELLPSSSGYVSTQNAYWAEYEHITDIFSNEHLALLFGNIEAKWVFTSLSRAEVLRTNKTLSTYIDAITENWYDERDIINGFVYNNIQMEGITGTFIESQAVEWLHKFYKWISDTKGRTELAKIRPIFLNQNKKAVPAFEKVGDNEHITLFLPVQDTEGYETIHPDLLTNEETKAFIQKLGITVPSLKDEIYNKILPLYADNSKINPIPHFKKFFQYYNECSQSDGEQFISFIEEYAFILYHLSDDNNLLRGKARDLYFPSDELQKWFKGKPKTKFIKLEYYINLIDEHQEKDLFNFLTKLGVKKEPEVLERELSEKDGMATGVYEYSTRDRSWIDKHIDGCEELINKIIELQDEELSVILWEQLLCFVRHGYNRNGFRNILYGEFKYFYYYPSSKKFESSEFLRLKTTPWLLDIGNKFCATNEIAQNRLSLRYDTKSAEALELMKYLDIKPEPINPVDDIMDKINNLPEEQKKDFIERFKSRNDDEGLYEASSFENELPTEDIPADTTRFTEKIVDVYKKTEFVEFRDVTRTQSERISGGSGDRADIEYRYGKFCQKCCKYVQIWEKAEMFCDLPRKELEQMYLSLCPNCAAEYRKLRNNREAMNNFKQSLINSQFGDSKVTLNENTDLYFTQRHLAEIKIILEQMEKE